MSSPNGQAARSAAGKAPTETGGIETKTGTGIATGRGPGLETRVPGRGMAARAQL